MRHRWGINILVLILLLFAVTQLTACGEDVEKSRRNLETGVVRIDLDGHRFNVPVRYMYYESKVKRGIWATPKKGRTEVDYLGFSVLLPDLRPYYPEDDSRWKVRGHGDSLNGSIMKPVGGGGWYEWIVKRELDDMAKGKSQRGKDKYGLKHFVWKNWHDTYLTKNGHAIVIICDNSNEVLSPSCKVKSSYREGIVFEYYYGLTHLSRWREIDDGIKAMFDKFGTAADAETLK